MLVRGPRINDDHHIDISPDGRCAQRTPQIHCNQVEGGYIGIGRIVERTRVLTATLTVWATSIDSEVGYLQIVNQTLRRHLADMFRVRVSKATMPRLEINQ